VRRFAEEAAASTSLAGLCTERGNTEEELVLSIRRSVKEAITKRHLASCPDKAGTFALSANEPIAKAVFETMRDADETDRLFLGQYAPSWEEKLFCGAYGRSFVASCVLPFVQTFYSVPVGTLPDSNPVRVLLETCPTASRLALTFRPPPSNLVRDVLLLHAALSGALFDLHRDPNRLLDGRLRSAVRALADKDPWTAPTVRLLEEMALVGAFTEEQVMAAHAVSDAAREALREASQDETPVHLGVAQIASPPAPLATTQISHLLLASQRAKTPVQLIGAPDHPLEIHVDGSFPGGHRAAFYS
jgi:hypothetical protein